MQKVLVFIMINFFMNVCNVFDTIQIVFLSLINPGAAAMGRFDLRRPTKKLGLPWWLSGKESACQAGDAGSIPGSGRSPGEGTPGVATHSSILVGLTPWSEEEPGRLQSMGLQRVGHDLVNTTTSEPMTIQKTSTILLELVLGGKKSGTE